MDREERLRLLELPPLPLNDLTLLTRLLRSSLETETGGDSRLAVIGCVSPGAADAEHSTSTLRSVMELAAATTECKTSTQDVPRIGASKSP